LILWIPVSFDWFDKLTTGKLPGLRIAGAGRTGNADLPAKLTGGQALFFCH
jgi:hypothetical protein